MVTFLQRLRAATGCVVLSLVIGACSGNPDLETLRSEVIVEAPSANLTGADLERWLMASPQKPQPEIVGLLISAWIDYALLAEAMRTGTALDDSASVAAGIWAETSRHALDKYFAARAARLPVATDAQADSMAIVGGVRAFQQLMLEVPADADTSKIGEVASRLDRYRKMAESGQEDFTSLVRKYSEDPVSKARDGYFEKAFPRDSLPGVLAGRFWALVPGAMTGVLSIPGGFAIFRRARDTEGRAAFKAWLQPILARRAEDVFRDSLVNALNLELAPGAVERVRALAREPFDATDDQPLVKWKDGGQFLTSSARRWMVSSAKAGDRAALISGSDSTVRGSTYEMALGDIVLGMAAPSVPSAEAWAGYSPAYRIQLERVKQNFAQFAGATPAAGEPTRIMDSLLIGGRGYGELPGAFGGVLRARFPVKVHHEKSKMIFDAVVVKWLQAHAEDEKN